MAEALPGARAAARRPPAQAAPSTRGQGGTDLIGFGDSGSRVPLAEWPHPLAASGQSACLSDRTSAATASVAPAARWISRTIAVPTTTPSA